MIERALFFRNCSQPLVALSRPAVFGDESQLTGAKQTYSGHQAMSPNDPERSLCSLTNVLCSLGEGIDPRLLKLVPT